MRSQVPVLITIPNLERLAARTVRFIRAARNIDSKDGLTLRYVLSADSRKRPESRPSLPVFSSPSLVLV